MDTGLPLDHVNVERILREGWRLFQQKGFRGVTLDELCLHCGLTKPTLYYYFHDKENLFVQVLCYQLSGFHEVIEQPGLFAERLQRIAMCILDSFQSEYNTLLRDREHVKNLENLQRIRDAFHSELFGPLAALMQLGIEQGELATGMPKFLTLVFLGMINNFIGRAAEFEMENAALAEYLVKYFLKGAQCNGNE